MKKILSILLAVLCFSFHAVAQTQQGYVKTRGRLAADGKSIIEGKRLANAVVTIEGRSSVKSGNDGTFSFSLPSGTNRYRVQNVQLKGYVLADPDALRQTHTCSKDQPLVVVLEDSKQREADLEAARRSVRNTMKREIRKKQDEIDSLLEVNAITQARYDSLMRDFWEFRQSSENLVSHMAEKYVSVDYDLLDDFNRQVQTYIETGQLMKADSMIRSKGSLEERYQRVQRAEAAVKREKDDLANDLYRQYLIFLQQPLMQDSALYCLKLRADMDTTNFESVFEYAYFADNQNVFEEAEKYYSICLRNKNLSVIELAITQNNIGVLYKGINDYSKGELFLQQSYENIKNYFNSESADNLDKFAAFFAIRIQVNLGEICSKNRNYDKSEEYYNLAAENCKSLYLFDSTVNNDIRYIELFGSLQESFGCFYLEIRNYEKSEECFKKALDNFETLFVSNPEAFRIKLFTVQYNLSVLYSALGDYTNDEYYAKLALKHSEILVAMNPDAYRPLLSKIQIHLAKIYFGRKDYENSEMFLKQALDNIDKYPMQYPNTRSDLAEVQEGLGFLYINIRDYENGLKYSKQAEENWEILSADNPFVYRVRLAKLQHRMAAVYANLNDSDKSEGFFRLALENYEKYIAENPSIHRSDLAEIQLEISNLYTLYFHDYINGKKYNMAALENYKVLFDENPNVYRTALATSQHQMGALFLDVFLDYTNGEKYFLLALKNREILFASNPEMYHAELANTMYGLAGVYYKRREYAKCDSVLMQVVENYIKLYDIAPDTYRAELANAFSKKMMLYAETQQMDLYDTYLAKTLEQYRILYSSDSSSYRQYVTELQNYTIERLVDKGTVEEALTFVNDKKTIDKTGARYHLAEYLFEKASQYYHSLDYVNSMKYNRLVLDIFTANTDTYRSEIAQTYKNMLVVYAATNQMDSFDVCLAKTLDMYRFLYSTDSTTYKQSVIELQNQSIIRMVEDGKIEEAIAFANDERTIEKIGTMESLAPILQAKAVQYNIDSNYSNSEKYYRWTVKVRKILYDYIPNNVYRINLASTYQKMVKLYEETKQFDKYDTCLANAAELYREIYFSDTSSFIVRSFLIELQNKVAWRMLIKGDVDAALSLARENYTMNKRDKTSKYRLAQCLNNKAYQYAKTTDYTNAMSSIEEAISLMPQYANFYDSKGEILLMQGRDQEALEMWNKVIELNPKFLDNRPNGTDFYNGLKDKGLIK